MSIQPSLIDRLGALPTMADEATALLRVMTSTLAEFNELSDQARKRSDWDMAFTEAKRGLMLANISTVDIDLNRALSLMFLGAVYHAKGELRDACQHYRAARDLFALGVTSTHLWNSAVGTFALGLAMHGANNCNDALGLYYRCLEAFRVLIGSDPDAEEAVRHVQLRIDHLKNCLRRPQGTAASRQSLPPMIGLTESGEPISAISVLPEHFLPQERVIINGSTCTYVPAPSAPQITSVLADSDILYAYRARSGDVIADATNAVVYVMFQANKNIPTTTEAVIAIYYPWGLRTITRKVSAPSNIMLVEAVDSKCPPPVMIFQTGDPTVRILGHVTGTAHRI